MKIVSVELKISAVRLSQYPEDDKREFLLLGRSNVGKSSFINAIINRKNYARTSSKPGKTQTLNFYLVNDDFYLVDVPGYGYASVDKKTYQKFGKMIEEYIVNREHLKKAFLLVDFRHKPSSDDVMMYNYLKYYNIPVVIVATKSDKISNNKVDKLLRVLKETFALTDEDKVILFSSLTKKGKDEVHNQIISEEE